MNNLDGEGATIAVHNLSIKTSAHQQRFRTSPQTNSVPEEMMIGIILTIYHIGKSRLYLVNSASLSASYPLLYRFFHGYSVYPMIRGERIGVL